MVNKNVPVKFLSPRGWHEVKILPSPTTQDELADYASTLLSHYGLPTWHIGIQSEILQDLNIQGLCDFESKRIVLKANDWPTMALVFLHELAHALRGPTQNYGRWPGHDHEWRRLCANLGYPVPAHYLPKHLSNLGVTSI